MFRVFAAILTILFAVYGIYECYLILTGSYSEWWTLIPLVPVLPAFARYALRGNPPARSIPQRPAGPGAQS